MTSGVAEKIPVRIVFSWLFQSYVSFRQRGVKRYPGFKNVRCSALWLLIKSPPNFLLWGVNYMIVYIYAWEKNAFFFFGGGGGVGKKSETPPKNVFHP